jgi:hypothetical protein
VRQARPRFDFRYIHYREDTANTRKLEKYVIKDKEDAVISRRK